MQREHMEGHCIAGLQRPAQLLVLLRLAVDVGQLGQRALGEPFRLLVPERTRHVPGARMGAGDKTQGARQRHRVDRDPEAHVLAARQVVVGLVLVPGRGLACARLLDQQMVVVQAYLLAAHQLCCHGRQRRAEQDVAVGRVVLPGTEVLDEAPWIVRLAGHQGQRTGPGQIVFDAPGQALHLAGVQYAAQHHRTITPEIRHRRRRQQVLCCGRHQPTHRRALRHNSIQGLNCATGWLVQLIWMLRNTRSGCGISAVKRPSAVVTAVNPPGLPFGLNG